MIDFFILLIKYWYITLPVLVIIGVLQQDDNKEKEKLKLPQLTHQQNVRILKSFERKPFQFAV